MSTDQPGQSVGPAGTFPGFSGPHAPKDDDLYRCVHCGFCLQACPTYLETGLESESPRGRIALMKAVREGRLEMSPSVIGHWDLCLQCRACELACPSGVEYGRLMEATRAQVGQHASRSFTERTARAIGYNTLLPSPTKLRMAGTALKLYKKTGMRTIARGTGMLKLLPGDAELADRYLPNLSKIFFKASGQVHPAQGVRKARVAMLAGCVMALAHAETLEATVRVLNRNGIEVHVTGGQVCCGALNTHFGEPDSAIEMAMKNIDSFLSINPDAIVSASAGCGAAMKDYEQLLINESEYADRAKQVADLTKDVHELLVEQGFDAPKQALNVSVTYQDPCHLANVQKITEAPRTILNSIPGLQLIELGEPALCCGSAGTYSLTQREMSARLGKRKAQNIVATDAAVVATANPGCAMQLDFALTQLAVSDTSERTTKVRYVIDLLDEAYSLE
ncbi:MAG: heterodisulfide reductase-related iron-sulfur binding cluster [Dehalococcoidia bacterium]|nr:heterodisulfide reductase-related iron-sulfur binding cluster [Dehalococcoidia bacterium]MDP7261181.1 heterodisulfide reductase-related iron-sulfur binding cluster [Dehalococcoidia bacterium]MDP7485878.1 heterodisulfide reductase-related iron-sulfur binding cluster [Dehalococcoidia bacterium]